MSPARLLLLSLFVLGGCTWPVRQETDRTVLEMANRPFDLAPPESDGKEKEAAPASKASASAANPEESPQTMDVQTVALLQPESPAEKPAKGAPKLDLKIPSGIPGSEAPPIDFRKMTPEQKQQAIRRLYPELPPLPAAPTPQPGPNGRAYTLADLQKLAAENSPTLRQAVSDVEAAKGALVQAQTYQNPTVAYSGQPNNNNSQLGARGGYIDQPIRMWGKRALGVAAAQKSVDNAQLALRRARSDLSTNVRNAYFGLIVAVETMRVNRALARFTDEIYRLYTGGLAAGWAAAYEPAGLRAQAYSTRLAYQQAVISYNFAWKQLVAAIGLPQLPLSEVSGRVDRLIPYYDYDKVLAHILARHTDVLTARNGVEIAQYNLKLAQITPYPDMDVNVGYWKEMTLAPFASYYTATVGFPIPLWDQNKGNIISAQAALIRAVEESHRVEMFWTNTLATNYSNYQSNLKALEYYRRYILPDQVRYYRGVFDRRQIDITASPNDLVTAQQALATNVQTYLGILGSLWSAVVSVADPLQTDDLFQLAQPRELPELPDLDQIPRWLCPHHSVAGGERGCVSAPSASLGALTQPRSPELGALTQPRSPAAPPPAADPPLPAPRQLPALPPSAGQRSQQPPADLTRQLQEPPPEIHPQTSIAGTVAAPPSGGSVSP